LLAAAFHLVFTADHWTYSIQDFLVATASVWISLP